MYNIIMEFNPTTKKFITTPEEQTIVGLNTWSMENSVEMVGVLQNAQRRNLDIDLQRFPAGAQNTELRRRQHRDARLIGSMLDVIGSVSTDPLITDIYTFLNQEQ